MLFIHTIAFSHAVELCEITWFFFFRENIGQDSISTQPVEKNFREDYPLCLSFKATPHLDHNFYITLV